MGDALVCELRYFFFLASRLKVNTNGPDSAFRTRFATWEPGLSIHNEVRNLGTWEARNLGGSHGRATQPCYGYSLGVSHDVDQEDSVLASLGAHRVLGSDSVDSGSGESAAIDG